MNIISNETIENKKVESTISNFFKVFKVGYILKRCNFYKEKGFSCITVLTFIFSLIFREKNLTQYLQSNSTKKYFGKDVVYRFMSNIHINWIKFIMLLASNVIIYLKKLTSESRDTVFIIDDSLYSRNSSSKVELLAKVFDHASHKFVKGFRMLTLGWSDGASLVPVSFNLLSSRKDKNILCKQNENIDKRSSGGINRKNAVLDANTSMLNMLLNAEKNGISAKYVLMDTWFSFPSTICKILNTVSSNVICMIKSTPKMKFKYEDSYLTLSQIYKLTKRRRGKYKYISSVIVEIGRDDNDKEIEAKIVFVKKYGSSKKWLALLSTDISISEEKIIEIYGKRWNIEVFFKIIKSYLGLAKEFQTRSYDSMIAHISIVFTRYMMLSYTNRIQKDPKTLGLLTMMMCDEIADLSFSEAFELLISYLKDAIQKCILASEETISKIINELFSKLPSYITSKLRYTPISA